VFCFVFVTSCAATIRLYAQANKANQTNVAFLKENAIELKSIESAKRTQAFSLAQEKGWETFGVTKDGKIFTLYGIDDFGMPLYKITENNKVSAATINTNKLYSGGSLGLNLNGSTLPNNKVALWDGGGVLTTHTEFEGNRVEIKDGATTTDAHATHVAGTIAAAGKYENARGMAYGLPKLLSFDFNNDNSEMSNYASGLLLSNHSYGSIAGWFQNTNAIPNRWEFRGRAGDNEDYKFGYYDNDAKEWDRICYNAPYYLPVKSAGNSRTSNGPAVGETYYRFNASGLLVNAGPRPSGIYSNDGYDILGTYAVAKNILTVAAVNPLPYGTVTPGDITISSFSSWGPTDDGRIKPDIAADGVDVTSTSNANNEAYTTYSGTSMAAPAVTGSLTLLQELYYQKNSAFMTAAALKGLAIATASEAGPNPGPDYIFGWGLMNTEKAAKAILDNGTKSLIAEYALTQGDTRTVSVVASGDGPLTATICWTDPEINVLPVTEALDNPTLRLVNDLDLRASSGTSNYLPWILDPANPSAAATKGDNFRDNVEQIFIEDAVPGKTYTFTISHKGTLQRNGQAYAVIVTGIGGKAYCASAPLSTSDSKIASFSLSNVNYTANNGCSTYTDLTNQTIELEKAKTYPLNISLGTCGANFNKIAKVFIDWNSDGDFEDANELTATSNVIGDNGMFTANISVPADVSVNSFSLLRVVLGEAGDAAGTQSCGTYAKGETQDYRVKFLNPSSDVGVTAIKDPLTTCTTPQQSVGLTIRNFGTQDVSGIPVTVTVAEGGNTVATLTGICATNIKPSQEADFVLPGYYAAESGKTYTITAKTALTTDPIAANNQTAKTAQVSLPPTLASGAAYYCENTKEYVLAAEGDGTVYWYKNQDDEKPFAYGNSTNTNTVPNGNGYYAGLNEYTSNFGPKNKYESRLGGGTYLQTSGGVNIRTFAPTILESARLYIGHGGTIRFFAVNSFGVEVSSATVKVDATRSTAVAGTADDDLSDQGKVYTINLKFPTAGNYTIYTAYEDGATIFRNNSVPRSIYPISSDIDVFNIIGNNASQPGSFYYYFYDITVKALGCEASARAAVPLSSVVIKRNGEELSSNISTGNQWYLDGVKIEGATSQTFTPSKTGKYQVQTAFGSGCNLLSNELLYLAYDEKTSSPIKLTAYPIPANRDLTVAFETTETQLVTISISNTLGRKVYEIQKSASGVVIETINVSTLPAGIYILNIRINGKNYAKKVMVM
jgi:hypothetical protein